MNGFIGIKNKTKIITKSFLLVLIVLLVVVMIPRCLMILLPDYRSCTLSQESVYMNSMGSEAEKNLYSVYRNLSDSSAEVQIEQNERQRTLRHYCKQFKKRKTNLTGLNRFSLFVSDKASIIYCNVPKAGCTNWKRLLQVFEGNYRDPLDIGDKQRVHTLHYKTGTTLPIKEMEWRRNLYYSFMIVRHPFERLLSAYRNKLQDPYNILYQRRYGSSILRYYRKGLTEDEYNAGKNVKFEEFVQYVITTFERYGRNALDPHWQIISNLCNPCAMKYNFIGKMETLVEDSEEILRQIGWSEKVKFPASAKDKYKNSIKDIMKEYYERLSRSSINSLYEIYKEDFLAFGYPMDEY